MDVSQTQGGVHGPVPARVEAEGVAHEDAGSQQIPFAAEAGGEELFVEVRVAQVEAEVTAAGGAAVATGVAVAATGVAVAASPDVLLAEGAEVSAYLCPGGAEADGVGGVAEVPVAVGAVDACLPAAAEGEVDAQVGAAEGPEQEVGAEAEAGGLLRLCACAGDAHAECEGEGEDDDSACAAEEVLLLFHCCSYCCYSYCYYSRSHCSVLIVPLLAPTVGSGGRALHSPLPEVSPTPPLSYYSLYTSSRYIRKSNSNSPPPGRRGAQRAGW